jgi:hypothetical protein
MEARTLCFPPRRTLRDRKLYRAACAAKYVGLDGLEYEIFYTIEKFDRINRLQLPRTSYTVPLNEKA